MDRSRKAFDELTARERRADFKQKNEVLKSHYLPIPAILFYSDFLYHDMNEEEFKPSIILYEGKNDGLAEEEKLEKSWKRKAINIDDIPDYFDRDDVAINPCAYWNDYPKARLMRRIYAFAMDVDEVRPDTMRYLIKIIEDGLFPRPTAITNSGSGVHFFFILDVAMQVGQKDKLLQNYRLAQQIYYRLHSKLKEYYTGAQKHHIGQDYRVVGSITKFGDTTTAWESGKFWKVEDLAKALDLDCKEFYQPVSTASGAMQAYATSIAKSLNIAKPDMRNAREVYDFIAEHKDAAYEIRETERKKAGKKKKKKLAGWYQTTWNRVYTKTEAGNRFNAMKGLAIVAYKAGISEERFEHDLYMLSTLWQERIWKGADPFNADNIEAIMRLYRNGERYVKTSRKTLEEYFGWKWDGQNRRKNGRSQEEHLKRARAIQTVDYPNGSWRNKSGAPTAQDKVQEWRRMHPKGKKADCIRDTGLSKPTVYKWWNGEADSKYTQKKQTVGAAKSSTKDWKSEFIKNTGLSAENLEILIRELEREEKEGRVIDYGDGED